jgi:hypothetical protein
VIHVLLAEDHEPVQAFLPNRLDKALDERIRVGER